MRKTNSTHRMKIFGIDDMLVGAAITGLGGMATNFFNSDNVDKTNAQNAANVAATNAANERQAQINRDFQERMSNSAYQRGMEDMKKAGLNPILAYQKGGASSPSGAQAALTAAHAQPFKAENIAAEAVNTGLAVRRSAQELQNMDSQNQNIKADTILKNSQSARTMSEDKILGAKYSGANLEKIRADIDAQVYNNSAGSVLRKTGTIAQEANRTAEPFVNSAAKLSPFRTRRSTSETTHSDGASTFNERFSY